jgi:heme/copper-type cytochrome/quinol oxidase subunit 2
MLPSLPPQLIDALYWVAVACCVVAQVAIVRSVLRAGAPGRMPDDATERRVPHSRRAVELVWVLVPAIGLAAVLVVTWRTIHARI